MTACTCRPGIDGSGHHHADDCGTQRVKAATLTIAQIGSLDEWKDNYGVEVRMWFLGDGTLVARQGDNEARFNVGGNRV